MVIRSDPPVPRILLRTTAFVGIVGLPDPESAAFSAMAMRSAFSRSFSSARSRSMAFPARCAPASTTRKSRS